MSEYGKLVRVILEKKPLHPNYHLLIVKKVYVYIILYAKCSKLRSPLLVRMYLSFRKAQFTNIDMKDTIK